ncbi:MAG: hypothetical protein CMK59_12455 [Proteobacteria bacterium]|nr:hypothetical protein [Pseudomonadota bacterium]
MKYSLQQLAQELAAKALLIQSLVEKELLNEWRRSKNNNKFTVDESILNIERIGLNSNAICEKTPFLKLYFVFHVRLMSMETSSSEKHRLVGFRKFADIYAQSICYGVLAARLMLTDQHSFFERSNVRELLPSTSAFLKDIFVQMLEVQGSKEIDDCLAELFLILRQADVESLFAKDHKDPVIHFYEDFLAAYGKDIKKSRGVYYTPDEVVKFIVLSIDEQLKTEFGLSLGLASTKTWKEVIAYLNADKEDQFKMSIPECVQENDVFIRILDPATGTGTFLKCVLEQIRHNLKSYWMSLDWSLEQMQKEWSCYVVGSKGTQKDYTGQGLLSRLSAFELMMAPYIVTHFRLGLFFQDDELPFFFGDKDRLNVFLTNALEMPSDNAVSIDVVKDSLSNEASLANVVKTDTAITVILGNPPYNSQSKNNGVGIMSLMEDYKKEPGKQNKLEEGNSKSVNNDYIKFIRAAQQCIEHSGVGILGFINPSGLLHNVTFRGVRYQLWKTFSKMILLNLNGKGRGRGGNRNDENVFDIQEPVCVNIFLKNNSDDGLARVQYKELSGSRRHKKAVLKSAHLENRHVFWASFQDLDSYSEKAGYYFLKPFDLELLIKFNDGLALVEYENVPSNPLVDVLLDKKVTSVGMFYAHCLGCVTSRDHFVVDVSKKTLIERLSAFLAKDEKETFICTKEDAEAQFNLKDVDDWKIKKAQKLAFPFDESKVRKISFRPFDFRYIYFDEHLITRPRSFSKCMLGENELSLIFKKGDVRPQAPVLFVSKYMSNYRSWSRSGMSGGDYVVPLNWRVEDKELDNLSLVFKARLMAILDIKQCTQKDIVDYVYAVAHHRRFIKLFEVFFSFGIPKFPLPKGITEWNALKEKGRALRKLHLLEFEVDNQDVIFLRNTEGERLYKSQEIECVLAKEAQKGIQVWINKDQYFDGVSQIAWTFFVGGYQPAQQWLKDRKQTKKNRGYSLSEHEITHYSKIIKALKETDCLMNQIETIAFLS